MKTNIINIFDSATATQQANGLSWYKRANSHAKYLAKTYNTSLNKVCGIIAALSPATSWDRNIKDTEELLKGNSAHKFGTYGQNVLKAYKILNASLEMDIELFFSMKTGAKTYNFYRNILEPTNPNYVTIDRHAIAVWAGTNENKAASLKLYREIAADYIAVAKQLNVLPCELQAITWVTYREKNVHEMHLGEPVPF